MLDMDRYGLFCHINSNYNLFIATLIQNRILPMIEK